MPKRVILLTGTPCVGKTSAAKLLTSKLNASYVNLTELAVEENLITGKDEQRNSLVVDEIRLRKRMSEIIKGGRKDVIVDGHYAVSVVPQELINYVFVLRRDPVELRKIMLQCGFSESKLYENLASEILDVCLVDALNADIKGKVCELDATRKSAEAIAEEILMVLSGKNICCVGVVDWLGKLEDEKILDEYLRI